MDATTGDRAKLIGAARGLLMEDGYNAVTAESACLRAEVDRGSFNQSFATRDDLVLAALNSHWSDLKGHLDQAFAPGVAPLEQLRRFFDGIYGFQDANWSKLGCVVGCLLLRVGSSTAKMDNRVRERVAEILVELQQRLERPLLEAQSQGKIRQGDVPTMAWTLLHYVEGVLGMARIQNDLHTLHGMMERSLEFLGADPPLLRR